MSTNILKYRLPALNADGPFQIVLNGSLVEILKVAMQNGEPMIWVEVDPTGIPTRLNGLARHTGKDGGSNYTHFDTLVVNTDRGYMVVHYYFESPAVVMKQPIANVLNFSPKVKREATYPETELRAVAFEYEKQDGTRRMVNLDNVGFIVTDGGTQFITGYDAEASGTGKYRQFNLNKVVCWAKIV